MQTTPSNPPRKMLRTTVSSISTSTLLSSARVHTFTLHPRGTISPYVCQRFYPYQCHPHSSPGDSTISLILDPGPNQCRLFKEMATNLWRGIRACETLVTESRAGRFGRSRRCHSSRSSEGKPRGVTRKQEAARNCRREQKAAGPCALHGDKGAGG